MSNWSVAIKRYNQVFYIKLLQITSDIISSREEIMIIIHDNQYYD